MGIGGGIFLIVVGAILAFAVSADVSGVNLPLVGYIMMGAGLLTIIVSLLVNAQRANTTHHEIVERHDGRPTTP